MVAQELYAVQDLYSLETVKHLGKEKRAGLIGCSCMKDGVQQIQCELAIYVAFCRLEVRMCKVTATYKHACFSVSADRWTLRVS